MLESEKLIQIVQSWLGYIRLEEPLIPWGFPFLLIARLANVSDDRGLIEMLTKNINYFKSKPVNIPKITILLDHGYHLEHLREELEKVYPEIMTKIRFELSPKPSKQEKKELGQSGFISERLR